MAATAVVVAAAATVAEVRMRTAVATAVVDTVEEVVSLAITIGSVE